VKKLLTFLAGLAAASFAAVALAKGWSFLWAIPFALWFAFVFVPDMNRGGDE